MLPEFELLMPKTLPEALEMLAEGAPNVTPLAGGTSLLVDMRGGVRRPRVLMNIAGLEELRRIQLEDRSLVVGSGLTIAELRDHPLVAQHAPVLGQGAAVFANPLVRNRATVGGNLVYASPAADTAPPLLVLGAQVELTSKAGSRRVPLEDFITGVRETIRRPDELLTAIRWPVPSSPSVWAFHKLALRRADAISVLSVAVMVERGTDGQCQVRIALGAAAPTPIRAHAAEELLCGQALTPEAIAEAGRLAAEATCCIDDIRGSAAYRKRVAGALVRRLLAQVAGEAQ
jgi:CO/xanthine dehydrogenase FAD-binding subunit